MSGSDISRRSIFRARKKQIEIDRWFCNRLYKCQSIGRIPPRSSVKCVRFFLTRAFFFFAIQFLRIFQTVALTVNGATEKSPVPPVCSVCPGELIIASAFLSNVAVLFSDDVRFPSRDFRSVTSRSQTHFVNSEFFYIPSLGNLHYFYGNPGKACRDRKPNPGNEAERCGFSLRTNEFENRKKNKPIYSTLKKWERRVRKLRWGQMTIRFILKHNRG